MKVLAIVVTYNRRLLLSRCLSAITSQTSKPDAVLIVNNNSNDGTNEYLKKNNFLHINQENAGSAGGWKTGIDYALEHNFDAVWMMDDDGYPDKFALQNLLLNFENDISCISSIVVNQDDKLSFTFPYPILTNKNFPIIFAFKRKIFNLKDLMKKNNSILYPYAQLFNGALIPTNIIKLTGNININYHIFGDETDFFYRLKKFGKVVSNISSIHFHPNVNKRKYNDLKIYYYLKNSIIINKKYMDYFFLRSILNILAVIIRTYKRNGFVFILKILFGKKNFFFYKAIFRGLLGKIGRDFHG